MEFKTILSSIVSLRSVWIPREPERGERELGREKGDRETGGLLCWIGPTQELHSTEGAITVSSLQSPPEGLD